MRWVSQNCWIALQAAWQLGGNEPGLDDSGLVDPHRVGRGSSHESGARLGGPSGADAARDRARGAGAWWSDDRLALVLDALAQPRAWQRFEAALNQRIIRVYQLQPQRVRLDSTTASGYWSVSEDGLFQLGYSKDHRPDLPQLKVMLSALDPLGLPLVTQVVAGKAADDPLYIPAIEQVSQSLPGHGVLYVGDCKMAALSTRAYVQAQGTTICALWPRRRCQPRSWTVLEASLERRASLTVWRCIEAKAGEERDEVIAEGYEQRVNVLSSEVAGQYAQLEGAAGDRAVSEAGRSRRPPPCTPD